MKLQLYINDQLIATVPLDRSAMQNPLYLSQKKIELEDQFEELLEATQTDPTFYLEIESSMNYRRTINF